jgi:DNA polymerase-1
MIQVDHFLHTQKLQSKMIMQVHDELVFNVVFDEITIIQKEIPRIMENILSHEVKLMVDI